jgi:cyclic pyranopterin phosphate synthase
MPAEGVPFVGRAELLTYEEIERVVRVLAPGGVRAVRITGGEPLVRHDIVELVRRVAAVPGVEDVALTTNGRLLPRHAADLAAAGLKRLNVSLDSTDRETFARVTRGDHLPEVLAGIEAALQAGIRPIKLNCVVVAGHNDGQVAALVRFARARGLLPRFIELMPMGDNPWFGPDRLVSSRQVRERLLAEGLELSPVAPGDAATPGSGPARHWRVREAGDPGAAWSEVGFISPITESFCDACNRIRLTSTGKIRACLGWDDAVSLRDLMRGGCTDDDLRRAIGASLLGKRTGHEFTAAGGGATGVPMSAVGG